MGTQTTIENALTGAIAELSQSQATVQAIVTTARALHEVGTIGQSHLNSVLHVAGLRGQTDLYWFEESPEDLSVHLMDLREIEDEDVKNQAITDLVHEIEQGVGSVECSRLITAAHQVGVSR